MSDCVPDFNATESNFSRPKKLATSNDEDVMELTWHNGQVVVQRSSKKPVTEPVVEPDIRPVNEQTQQQQHLFMQEDEMASWLQYPLEEKLFSAPPPEISPRSRNFTHLSRPRSEEIPASSTIVESNVTPVAVSPDNCAVKCGVSADFSRKRKDKEAEGSESQYDDIEVEAVEAKKQALNSSSTKRSRAAQVHNLSERRRRDRINERMKALQELIPRCNKSDKASMLDEAVEYLKSLQMQVQMMSTGYGMMPMMYPGMQQYMPAMGMGMNRPILPYPTMVQGTGIPNPASAAVRMGPRFPIAAFQLPPVRLPDPSRIQIPNQRDVAPNSFAALNPNLPQMPNFVDPYQQFLGLQQAQLALQHNQLAGRSNADNPSTSKEAGNPEHQQTGRM